MSRRTDRLKQGLATGGVAAVSVMLVERVLNRFPSINETTGGRVAFRVAAGIAGSVLADALDAPESVVVGVYAGPVAIIVLDASVSLIGRRRLDPPPARNIAELGQPWAPTPLYVDPQQQELQLNEAVPEAKTTLAG
jgi:hypothetical protein